MALSTTIKDQKVSVGDTVQVHQTIQEEEKTRSQVFEGVVIAIKGRESGKSFTVRKIASGGIGVERIWPILTPSISKVSVVKKGHVRRSKLYYLRKRTGRERIKVKNVTEGKKASEKAKPRKRG